MFRVSRRLLSSGRPLFDRVKIDTQTVGGIVTPENQSKVRDHVVAAGSGAKTRDGQIYKYYSVDHYDVPIRVATMDDCMEPYGSWEVAYNAEKKRANGILLRGITCFVSACLFVYYTGVFDGVLMPNLDDIMDTKPFEFEKGEDRVSV